MGRHSSPEQGPYYRSFIVWALPWIMIVTVVLVAVWIAIDAVGGDELTAASQRPPAATQPIATQEAEPTAEPAPTESQGPKNNKRKDRPPKQKEERPQDELITAGVTVQVLNGTAVTTADDRMASRLSGLGYEVVAIDGSSRQYARTTVFWSYPSAREAAERLAERFGWLAQPKPANLSSTVDLHVVVGGDEA